MVFRGMKSLRLHCSTGTAYAERGAWEAARESPSVYLTDTVVFSNARPRSVFTRSRARWKVPVWAEARPGHVYVGGRIGTGGRLPRADAVPQDHVDVT